MGEDQQPTKEEMFPCDSQEMRAETGNKDVEDGINGTVTVSEKTLDAIGVGANDKIQVLVEANGKSAYTEREIHASGNTFTLPKSFRKRFGLEPGDEIRFWIDSVDEPKQTVRQSSLTSDEKDRSEELSVWFVGEQEYHYVASEDADETQCGRSLQGEDYRGPTNDSGEFLDLCSDCAVRSSREMTIAEIVQWFGDRAGFEMKEGGPDAFMNKDQLITLRDYIIELEEKSESD
jgi:bifunctional DNA-binding transcriptional regulator/antitoxin component of YhaV-PrlF toxin-antitoxin module